MTPKDMGLPNILAEFGQFYEVALDNEKPPTNIAADCRHQRQLVRLSRT